MLAWAALLLYYTTKPAHAVPLASACQHPENQKVEINEKKKKIFIKRYVAAVIANYFTFNFIMAFIPYSFWKIVHIIIRIYQIKKR